jgi:sulfate adenylyltransferase
MTDSLIEPHGGRLQNLIVSKRKSKELVDDSIDQLSWTLTDRQLCDLDMLLSGAFSPLDGFLGREDYKSVVETMRLKNGILWPMPVTLDVTEDFANSVSRGEKIILRDKEGFALAVLILDEKWKPDLLAEATNVFNSTDIKHPGVNYLLNFTNPVYLGGSVEGISLPKYYDYQDLRLSPEETRAQFKKRGWENVVAFQTRNPMHQAHVELTMRAAANVSASVLIHPVVGLTKPGDVDHFTRVRCYEKVLKNYPHGTVMLSLCPLAMRMGGPREALWHAIIRKNYGCNYLIVGRDHAGPGTDSNDNPFYGPYDAQELLQKHEDEVGIRMVPFKRMVYVEDRAEYRAIDEVSEGTRTLSISGSELRRRLDKGLDIPDWFSYPDVVAELRNTRPPLNKRGFSVFFTGLSGSGKSTLAHGLMVKLMEDGRRPVTLLDGDIVRTHLSSELGFSQKDRSINVQRIGYVASEITKNFGIALCAPIAPYRSDRRIIRELIGQYGGFIEAYVNTPISVCEARDVKGLYAKARQGIIKDFTGVNDPYEEPENPEIVINSSDLDPEILVQEILLKIEQLGYI